MSSKRARLPEGSKTKITIICTEEQEKHIHTQETLAHLRHTIDTRDKFYDDEMNFWNSAMPELQEYAQKWTMTMLNSPFRADFEKEFGGLMFLNAEIALKTFSPEIIPLLQKENVLPFHDR